MKLKFSLVLFLICIMFFSQGAVLAETTEGRTVRLEKFQGNVSVMTGTGKEIGSVGGMRLFDGYTITTANDSFAYLSIDEMKSIKLDQNTKVSIVKKDKVNEIQVSSGSIFFGVKEKLKDDETLDIVTPTMSIGIRGTSGVARVRKSLSLLQVYSGKVLVRNNRGTEKVVNSGEEARDSEIENKNLEIVKLKANGEDIPSFGLNEINVNEEIREQISKEQIFDLEGFVEYEQINKEKETGETAEEMNRIEAEKNNAEIQRQNNLMEVTEEISKVEVLDEGMLNQGIEIGSYVAYSPEKTLSTVLASDSGYDSNQEFNPSLITSWRVLYNNNGQLDIISTESVGNLTLDKETGYAKAVHTLNAMCSDYVNLMYATGARSVGASANSTGIINTDAWPLTHGAIYKKNLTYTPYVDNEHFADMEQINKGGLLQSDGNIWVASRYTYSDSYSGFFYVRWLSNKGNVSGDYLCGTYTSPRTYGVRPVVSLKAGVKITGGDGTAESPYTIEMH